MSLANGSVAAAVPGSGLCQIGRGNRFVGALKRRPVYGVDKRSEGAIDRHDNYADIAVCSHRAESDDGDSLERIDINSCPSHAVKSLMM